MSTSLTEERIRQIINEEMKDYGVRKRASPPASDDEHGDDHHYGHHGNGWGPHDWEHGAPHNSWAPIIMSFGITIFLFGFASTFVMNDDLNDTVFNGNYLPMVLVGFAKLSLKR